MLGWILATSLALNAPAPPPTVTPPEQVMALPPELQAQLHERVIDPNRSQTQRLQRLVEFMFSPQDLGMTYQEDATVTVAQAYATRKANCLTFTLLFLALAREAKLDAFPREIEQTLAWRQEDGTLFRSNHINAGVRIGARDYTADVAGDSVIARDDPVRVTDARLLSHYYNNLAVAHMAQGQLEAAQANIAMALQLDPAYANHWSNAGVLEVRSGDTAAGERDYLRALQLDADNANALFNLAGLAHRSGDATREAEYRRRLDRVQQRDPFHHFLQAINFERTGDYANAIRHYRRAISLYGKEPRFHAALARAYTEVGNTRQAARALARAQALSTGGTRAAYGADLDHLRQALGDRP